MTSTQILLTQEIASDALDWLLARHAVDVSPELCNDRTALLAALPKYHGLIVPSMVHVNQALLDVAPSLKVVARLFETPENIDFSACHDRAVRVVQAPDAAVQASVEFLLSSLLMLYRQGASASVRLRKRHMARGREIGDSLVGLIGMTPVAHGLAKALKALGARVIGYDPMLNPDAEQWARLGVQPVGLEQLTEMADAVSVQLHYVPRYRGLIGQRALERCKPGQLWVSSGRTEVFDLLALATALRDGRIADCHLDSDQAELKSELSPLRSLPHLRITPSLAAHTREAFLRASWYLADRVHETLLRFERLEALEPSQGSAAA